MSNAVDVSIGSYSAEDADRQWLDDRLIDYTEHQAGEFTDTVTRFWELNGGNDEKARIAAQRLMGLGY